MSPEKTYSSICPSTENRRRRPVLLAVLVTAIGCATGGLPDDVRETFRNGGIAEERGNLEEAIIHYARVLDAYPDLVDALIARGACYRRLASESEDPESQERDTWAALSDFEAAAANPESEPRLWIVAQMSRAMCLVDLDRSREARAVLDELTAREDLGVEERADAHRLLGNLFLCELHAAIPVDEVIAPGQSTHLTHVREARRHFGETLELVPGDPVSLFGKAICLLHEGLLEESEALFLHVQEYPDPSSTGFDAASTRYLYAVARERRLGPNRESQDGYLRALAVDESRHYDPVYLRLYRLFLEDPGAVTPFRRQEALTRLLEYRGENPAVWRAADRYFASDSAREVAIGRLGHAVARARLGDPRAALESFASWLAQGIPAGDAVPAAEQTFRMGPRVTAPYVELRMTLEKARAYQLLFPDDLDARRASWDDLREVVDVLASEKETPEQVELYADVCALLAEELLSGAETEEKGSLERIDLLREAERLALCEGRLRPDADARVPAEFRLARIDFLRSEPLEKTIEFAIRALRKDPTHSYRAAYLAVAAEYSRLLEDSAVFREGEDRTFDEVEDALLTYQGTDETLAAAKNEVVSVRQRRAEARLAALRLEEERKKAESVPQPPVDGSRQQEEPLERDCPECGGRARKTDPICPNCGYPFHAFVQNDGKH